MDEIFKKLFPKLTIYLFIFLNILLLLSQFRTDFNIFQKNYLNKFFKVNIKYNFKRLLKLKPKFLHLLNYILKDFQKNLKQSSKYFVQEQLLLKQGKLR